MDNPERRITNKGKASRQRLLSAAAQEFAQKGYQLTKVSDIVKAAGLTQAAFYLYFPSKETIFIEMIEEFREQILSLAKNASDMTHSPQESAAGEIREKLKEVFRFLHSSPELTKVAWFEAPDAYDFKQTISTTLAQTIRKNQEFGHMSKALAADVVAASIVGTIEGLTRLFYQETGREPEQLAEQMADLLLYGVLAGASASSQP